MKSTFCGFLAVVVCSPVFATKAATASMVAPEIVEHGSDKIPLAVGESKAEAVAASPTSSNSNFCGQAQVFRLLIKTEIGHQLQLRHQQALEKSAIAEEVRATPPKSPQAATTD